MVKDIRQTKVLKHNKEQDIHYIFGHCIVCPALCCILGLLFVLYLWPLYCMSCSLLCFRTFVCLISLAIVLYVLLFAVSWDLCLSYIFCHCIVCPALCCVLWQTKVLKHNKEQHIQCNGQRYKTNKSFRTQQRAGHTIR
jgi:hypothetical protein